MGLALDAVRLDYGLPSAASSKRELHFESCHDGLFGFAAASHRLAFPL